MNVVLYGATGKSGSRIMKELLSRGHKVTAAVRDTSKLNGTDGITVKQDDLSDVSKTADAIKGADAVVSAYAPPQDNTNALVCVTKVQVAAVKKAGVPRLLVVGGAGGLEIAPGVSLINSGHLPEPYLPIAKSHVNALEVLQHSDIDWTYFAPAGFFEPGERTGKFRLGTNELISNEKGESRISMEDYAIALVDELEKPAHRKQRFSIGY
ncbi:MAG: NAD-dependent epimerase/dehydratase [Acidobacteriales bacterium]|nr:NAD-dependent epimerase/dehydratase [Terriglobales bacterium]